MAVGLLQIIHLAEGRPRLVGEHVAWLDRASRALFGRAYQPDIEALQRRLVALAEREHYPSAVSGFVRVEIDEEGREQLIPLGTSLYAGYALRSLRPTALTIPYELPLQIAGSTAAEAAHELARCVARRHEADEALRINEEGICCSLGAAELFALRGGELYTSFEPRTVEGRLLLQAAETLQMRWQVAPVRVAELGHFDELFAVDYRGITALASCDGHAFMSLRAERLAVAMERLATAR